MNEIQIKIDSDRFDSYLLSHANRNAEGIQIRRHRPGELSKQLLQRLDRAGAEKALLQIRGVGSWTANYVLMRCLGFRSAFPIEDIGLHNAIQRQLGLSNKPTLDEIRMLSSSWADWQAYATFYLYRSLL